MIASLTTVRSAFAALSLIAAAHAGAAQNAPNDYPTRPIRLLVPFPPGGGADALARIMTPKLTESMHQTWVVDNRGGAGGNLATEVVVTAQPDGYSVLLGFSTTLVVNPLLYKLPFDVMRDLQPITKLASAQYILVLHPSVPAATLKDFIALAKSAPNKLNYSSAGVGSPLHLAAEMFKLRAGVDLVHVPYKGGGPAAAAVLGGEVQVLFGSVASTMPQVKAGKLKALAVTGLKRSAVAPNLPTLAESGFPGFDVSSWYSLLVPAKTPRAIVKRLFDEAVRAVNLPDVQEAFGRQGLEVETSRSPEEFAAQMKAETAAWQKVIKTAGIHAD
ncbi:MAG TPA: tripartite tricarboxylate transporter substrate binding protein [Burkholderiales bacterium]|jgi:tripartite-type tricarboxylate transporter receptor subunit TctC|nr:tripartite tricarboxylate transporter substrate binding protein [Burkholderiales bacterium]